MRYKNNVLEKLTQTDTLANRLQLQVNRNNSQEDLLQSVAMLKESIEKIREIVSIEPDDLENQFI